MKTPEDSVFTGIAESNDPAFQIEKILKSVRVRHTGMLEEETIDPITGERVKIIVNENGISCMPECRVEMKQDIDSFLGDEPEDPAMPIDAESSGSEIYEYKHCSHCKEYKLCKFYSGKPYCRECAIRIFNDKNWGKFGVRAAHVFACHLRCLHQLHRFSEEAEQTTQKEQMTKPNSHDFCYSFIF